MYVFLHTCRHYLDLCQAVNFTVWSHHKMCVRESYLVIGFSQDHKLGRCLAASSYDETSSPWPNIGKEKSSENILQTSSQDCKVINVDAVHLSTKPSQPNHHPLDSSPHTARLWSQFPSNYNTRSRIYLLLWANEKGSDWYSNHWPLVGFRAKSILFILVIPFPSTSTRIPASSLSGYHPMVSQKSKYGVVRSTDPRQLL